MSALKHMYKQTAFTLIRQLCLKQIELREWLKILNCIFKSGIATIFFQSLFCSDYFKIKHCIVATCFPLDILPTGDCRGPAWNDVVDFRGDISAKIVESSVVFHCRNALCNTPWTQARHFVCAINYAEIEIVRLLTATIALAGLPDDDSIPINIWHIREFRYLPPVIFQNAFSALVGEVRRRSFWPRWSLHPFI